MRKYLLLIVLALFSAQVSAAWELLNSDDKTSTYVDLSTIREQGAYTAMWILIDYNSAQKSTDYSYWSSKYLQLFSCKERTSGMKMVAQYDEQMGLGTVVFAHSLKPFQVEFSDVIPGSIGELQLEAACGKK